MTIVYAVIAFAVLLTAIKLSHNAGVQKGRILAANGSHNYLMARIGGAVKRVTPLNITDFEQHCASTVESKLFGTPDWWTHICFKKAGECGEFMEHVGKASRDDGWTIFDGVDKLTPERRDALIKEIGDGWWYDIMILRDLGSNATECMLRNIEKREGRKVRGTIKGAGDNR